MGFLDKVKQNVQEGATLAREGVEKVQLKREIAQEQADLGRTVFELVEKSELSHPAVQMHVDKIRELQEELAGIGAAEEEAAAPAATGNAASAEPPRVPPRAE